MSRVVKDFEFWFFFLSHAALVSVGKLGFFGEGYEDAAFPMEALEMMQFMMTFFLLFFNSHALKRFNLLFDECMKMINSVEFFTQLLVVEFPDKVLERYRLQAAKYVLATLYIFFMQVKQEDLTSKQWDLIMDKGLLTQAERDRLRLISRQFGHLFIMQATTSWAMQIVQLALRHECLHKERMMQRAHAYNRFNSHIVTLLKSIGNVEHMLANPMPYPYFHAMNFVLCLNFAVVSVVLSIFLTYMTIFPYAITLLIFLGIRETAGCLSDPFGQDSIDFPLHKFLEHAFDSCVALLESFSSVEDMHILQQIDPPREFTEEQILRKCDWKILYGDEKGISSDRTNAFAWVHPTGLQARWMTLAEGDGLVEHVRKSLLHIDLHHTSWYDVEDCELTIEETADEPVSKPHVSVEGALWFYWVPQDRVRQELVNLIDENEALWTEVEDIVEQIDCIQTFGELRKHHRPLIDPKNRRLQAKESFSSCTEEQLKTLVPEKARLNYKDRRDFAKLVPHTVGKEASHIRRGLFPTHYDDIGEARRMIRETKQHALSKYPSLKRRNALMQAPPEESVLSELAESSIGDRARSGRSVASSSVAQRSKASTAEWAIYGAEVIASTATSQLSTPPANMSQASISTVSDDNISHKHF